MTEKQNPLYHEVKGDGRYHARLELDGMNRFISDYHPFLGYDPTIAKVEGATLRYNSERDICDMKVYHPTEKDVDGDTCSIAVYDFYNLKLDSMSWGSLYFKGLLTGIRHHGGVEPEIDDRDGYPYLPPEITTSALPVPVRLVLWIPTEDD